MNIPAVGLDVDGVIANFTAYAYPFIGVPLDHPTWDVPDNKQADLYHIINEPNTWVSLKTLPGAVEAVSLLVQAGVIPVFITCIPKRFTELRKWWIEDRFGPQLGRNPVYLENVAAMKDKPVAARQYELTHFVEDKRTNANLMAKAGFTSILVPSSYHADGEIHPAVRVQPLLEFAMEITNAVAR